MREFKRTDRVADQLQKELAVLIQREVKDPRLGMVTVSGVEVSRDLGYADVHITLLGEQDPERIKENLKVLKRAGGFLRSQVARRIKLRHVPELRFHYDESVVRGQHLSSLIEEAVASDRSRHPEGDDENDSGEDGAKD
ncbi:MULTISPECIES: 30S ribosome-binding factor RbfA [unclassified Halomonas]|jgi:ribosome-binding factor A|uniref:30S ribosome-binding factor RbfA n=1 Tax=Halomonas TaxID=2745 RepID=UPI0005FA7636|nr:MULTISPECIES: 30S ribosome-binding factor RbfA [unclassified Halomonas]MBR9771029.1 30S ribosome-binding factor RbfA [Gammaproteobacteria bacterium]MBS8267547.1 30S ribosome-binding factor RbfA [Halomonas litopenaei]KJZ16653.1 ribosome-binding factor A [Halomonas sp. S2151]MCO7214443.1 30S ribosome-binding factor RbfA [Halomonas sp. OfavH-34-E]RQW69178.1 30S ribosome-binding factor RbfA [Halomonas sp. YLB-10]|tara:strand:+ start:1717 stop:2133 length:417 start_codon:yes stop_codon:yes gene_type:complete